MLLRSFDYGKSTDLRARQRARPFLESARPAVQRAARRGLRSKKATQRRPGPDRRSGSQRAAQIVRETGATAGAGCAVRCLTGSLDAGPARGGPEAGRAAAGET